MKPLTALFCFALLLVTTALPAQEKPMPAMPGEEHKWLAQLAGEWTTEGEAIVDPSQPPFKCEGTESARMIGGLWLMGELQSKPFGMPMTGIITVGYDPEQKKFVGTWIDTMQHKLWKYEGTLDKEKNILTLEADGPNPMEPGKTTKYRDVIELADKNHKILRSSMQLGDKWVPFMTMHYKRKK